MMNLNLFYYPPIKTEAILDPEIIIYINPLTAAATLGLTPKYSKEGILTKPAPTPNRPLKNPEVKAAPEIFTKLLQSMRISISSYL